MKKIKKIFNLILMMTIIIGILKNISYGAEDVNGIYLSLKGKSNRKETGYYLVSGINGIIPLPEIVKTNINGTVEFDKDGAIYSLKNGKNFISNSNKTVHYTQYFDLKEPDSITPIYKNQLPQDEDTYNELMWVLENICLTDNENSKRLLLGAAGINENEFKNYVINNCEKTDIEKDIIEAIQQAAIWYFTNPTGQYHPIENADFFVENNNITKNIEKYNLEGENTNAPTTKLYNFLIEGAKKAVKNGYNYLNSYNEAPIILDKSSATVSTNENNYLVGPYKLVKNNTQDCTINISITDGAKELENVTILNSNKNFEISGESTTKKILSTLGNNFYISIPINTSAKNINIEVNTVHNNTSLIYWTTTANMLNNTQPVVNIKKQQKNIKQIDTKQIAKPRFDLAIRTFVTTINGEKIKETREPKYSQEDLRKLATEITNIDNGTTLTKTHKKSSIFVEKGDKIVFTIRVYNEGQIDGKATEISDYLPNGLEIVPISESSINSTYKWQVDNNRAFTNYLDSDQTINAFNNDPSDGKYVINYKDIQIECIVTAETTSTDTFLKNIVEITKSHNDNNLLDRDSNVSNITEEQKKNYNPGTSEEGKGYEDDDDFENIVIQGKYFDLALRKFITNVDNKTYKREPNIDLKPLLEGQDTASYFHSKGPISIEAGNVVTYTIRIYNEGQIDGYADEIVEHLPEELEFINDEFNAQYGWIIDTTDETQRTIKTNALSKQNDEDNIIKAFDTTEQKLSYRELKIRCKISATAPTMKEITSVTEITQSSNSANLADKDNKSVLTLPSDSELQKYKGNASNKNELADITYYYKGQEDDDDFEKVILEKFDLNLKQFISAVNNEKIDNRQPYTDLADFGKIVNNVQITNCVKNNEKEPLKVVKGDTLTVTIRIFNEGTQPGYAAEIKDYVPEGLEFIPQSELNQYFRWTMHDEKGNVTTNLSELKYLTTDYLAKEIDESKNLIGLFDVAYRNEPEYRDIKVLFKVLEPTTENRIIENKAQISNDTDINGDDVTDIDSNTDSWNENEDGGDIEKLYVKYFDLSLNSSVLKTIIIEDGIEKDLETSNNSTIKVELEKKNFEDTVVKFRYNIKVTNEGEIPGYVKEISDYIPDGFKFNQADNQDWKELNGKVINDSLKNTLLNPGDSQTIDITLTWINEEENLGMKKNAAEISKTYNYSDSPDIDSIPNNKQEEEDDISNSAVAVAVSAGSMPTYIALISGILIIISIGLIIIKKYVL